MRHPLTRELFKSRTGQRFKVADREYDLAGKIGDGAAGVVRKARVIKGGEVFAVKFLAPDPKYIEESAFDDVATRFKREGEKGPKLQHRGLIEIDAYCENPGSSAFIGKGPANPFIIMEYATGRTLEDFIRKMPKSERGVFQTSPESLFIAIQVADALHYLHSRKVVHRDVKPANIFLAGYSRKNGLPIVKLGDFGIVKWGDFHSAMSTGGLTATNQKGLGTMKYMSPEQAVRPRDVTVRSDIYSLGVTLFELFTGQILLSPHHVFEVMSARLQRGSTQARFLEIGYSIPGDDEHLAGIVLDMHLRGTKGRPKTEVVLGTLARRFEDEMGHPWTEELL